MASAPSSEPWFCEGYQVYSAATGADTTIRSAQLRMVPRPCVCVLGRHRAGFLTSCHEAVRVARTLLSAWLGGPAFSTSDYNAVRFLRVEYYEKGVAALRLSFPKMKCGCPILAYFARVGRDAAATIISVMPRGLHRYYGADQLHFITFSCYRGLPLLRSARSRDTCTGIRCGGVWWSKPEGWRWSSSRFHLLDESGPVCVNQGWKEISFRKRAA
jgi:hypothetical protein